ncbi:hypothetical protein 7S3_56 [uncultured Caudovirales phage]|uniref:Uncharacterized protein n=1 Tax=uncultured Caudovirales phage TaxID=2100421 RepID=A0A2H4J2B6_9CAUD|nr:hypothetical protein 7S3_56 [uncultured Caudovirales phage]MBM4603150.1 hypothetical protein [Prescottella equi]
MKAEVFEVINESGSRRHFAATGFTWSSSKTALCGTRWVLTFEERHVMTKRYGGGRIDYAKKPMCKHCERELKSIQEGGPA